MVYWFLFWFLIVCCLCFYSYWMTDWVTCYGINSIIFLIAAGVIRFWRFPGSIAALVDYILFNIIFLINYLFFFVNFNFATSAPAPDASAPPEGELNRTEDRAGVDETFPGKTKYDSRVIFFIVFVAIFGVTSLITVFGQIVRTRSQRTSERDLRPRTATPIG